MPAPAATADNLCPVMLFSGKGGVGKTTLAAATAVHLARGSSRVLVLSTDPAHNLSDVLDTPLSPTPRAVLPGLDAMEVDARGMFGQVAEAAAAQGALGSLLRTVSETPGVDEFGAIEVLLQVLEHAQHDVVIVDTAPTGHTLRLLMVPQLLEGWFGTLLKLRHSFARAGRLLKRILPGAQPPPTEEIERELSGGRQRIAQLRDQLTDPERSQIILVTIAEPMSVLETSRTMQMLGTHGMAVGTIVVNQLQPPSPGCPHCARRREIHQLELADLRRRAPDAPIRLVESLPRKIAGPQALAQLGETLWSPEALWSPDALCPTP